MFHYYLSVSKTERKTSVAKFGTGKAETALVCELYAAVAVEGETTRHKTQL